MKNLTKRILYGNPINDQIHCDRCGELFQIDGVCYLEEVAEILDRTGKGLLVHVMCRIDSDEIA